MALDVVVLGGANIDHCVTAAQLPVAGETVNGKRYFVAFGGKGANQAVAVARAGARTAMLARVGDDTEGQSILENLRANKVDISGVKVDGGSQTGSAHIVVSEAGQNQIVVVPGANHRLSPQDVSDGAAFLRNARILMMVLEGPIEATLHAARLARGAGKVVVLDPAPAPAPPDALPGELYQLADFILPNETEATALTGVQVCDRQSAEQALRIFRARGVKTPVVKLGAQGAVALWGDEVLFAPPFDVKVVDSTAAGDAFAGGFCAALIRGLDISSCLRAGCAAGALACTKYGAMPSLPYAQAIQALTGE